MVCEYFFTQLSSKFFRRKSLMGQLFKKKKMEQFYTKFFTHTQEQIRNVGVTSFSIDYTFNKL